MEGGKTSFPSSTAHIWRRRPIISRYEPYPGGKSFSLLPRLISGDNGSSSPDMAHIRRENRFPSLYGPSSGDNAPSSPDMSHIQRESHFPSLYEALLLDISGVPGWWPVSGDEDLYLGSQLESAGDALDSVSCTERWRYQALAPGVASRPGVWLGFWGWRLSAVVWDENSGDERRSQDRHDRAMRRALPPEISIPGWLGRRQLDHAKDGAD